MFIFDSYTYPRIEQMGPQRAAQNQPWVSILLLQQT